VHYFIDMQQKSARSEFVDQTARLVVDRRIEGSTLIELDSPPWICKTSNP